MDIFLHNMMVGFADFINPRWPWVGPLILVGLGLVVVFKLRADRQDS